LALTALVPAGFAFSRLTNAIARSGILGI